ncbi:hypothetical protein RvY_03556 [Ramazzottius varieornatus]|uniref:Uncharacterized protein n=1 Tax=Ramazzottius varieornatus TaxID=947166 RepID=A0A1D1UNH6_RAMVA|nr:hypothetical protein RvY_03556 [Ramazzottius varieornatus]
MDIAKWENVSHADKRCRSTCEESSKDLVAVGKWFLDDLLKILLNIDPKNLNADETGLRWPNVGIWSLVIGGKQETGL